MKRKHTTNRQKPSSKSPTQRTLAALRKTGSIAAVAERWNSFTKTRQDLFGFIDIIAVTPSGVVLAIQATTQSNLSGRIRKVMSCPDRSQNAAFWTTGKNRVQFWGWYRDDSRVWNVQIIQPEHSEFFESWQKLTSENPSSLPLFANSEPSP